MEARSTEELAAMSMEELELMGVESEGEKSAEESASDSATNDEALEQKEAEQEPVVEQEGDNVAMKSGKGTIPYAVLKETRAELAETRKMLEEIKAKSSYQAPLPADYADQETTISTAMKDLADKFENGDITWEEYQVSLTETTIQRENLFAAKIKSEIAAEMLAQQQAEVQEQAKAGWGNAVNDFLKSKPDGIDYNADQEKYDFLDASVKMYASNPANNDRDYQWFLNKGHAEVRERFGVSASEVKPPRQDVDYTENSEAPFNSLSDIPGGMISGTNNEGEVLKLSGAALTARFLNDPGSIDKVLAELG